MKETSSYLDNDGHFVLNWFEQIGAVEVERWLKNRLQGNDPWCPVDERHREAPDSLVAEILRQAGQAHPAAKLIGRAAANLLDISSRKLPQIQTFLPGLLGLCQRVRVPEVSAWFLEELASVVGDLEAAETRWNEELPLLVEVLRAAHIQTRSMEQTRPFWQQLLLDSSFTTLALNSVADSFEERLPYLSLWWEVAPKALREGQLIRMLTNAFRKVEGGKWVVWKLTSTKASMLPVVLRAKITQVFKRIGLPGIDAVPATIQPVRTLRNRRRQPQLRGAARRPLSIAAEGSP